MAKWTIDPDHSVAALRVRHFMIADVRGQFNKLSGTIYFDPPDLTSVSVEVAIDASVMTTGIIKRDEHLQGPDFLDTAKFPEISFRSTKVEITGLTSCKVAGELTVRGITKPVVLDAEYLGPVKSPWGETSIGIRATATVNREDFGMTWNEPMENNGFVVGRDVHLTLHIEADLAEDDT